MFRCNHHHQGVHYLSLLKLQLLKQSIKICAVNLVVWLHVLSGPCPCMSVILFQTVRQAYRHTTAFHPDPARSCQQTCVTYTIAVCTVKNS